MPKINQEEYEILKKLENKDFKWLAKDRDKELLAFQSRPSKAGKWAFWVNARLSIELGLVSHLFQFIQWEDEEPHNIAELIEEYENTIVITEFVDGKWRNRIKESEETEVKKDKEGLVKYLEKEISNFKPGQMIYDYLTFILKQLNQLDEPEVLSQKWIDENVVHVRGLGDIIEAEAVENLLVPKRVETGIKEVMSDRQWEEVLDRYKWHLEHEGYTVIEKPVIPRFVADILEENTFADLPTAFEELFSANAGHYYGEDVCKWIVSNEETFVRAWLDGYTLEEEQKYFVDDSHRSLLCKWDGDVISVIEAVANDLDFNKLEFVLTEQEIKDYDSRYFAFAKKVEELEE